MMKEANISVRLCLCLLGLVWERVRVPLGFPHARIRGACFPSNWESTIGHFSWPRAMRRRVTHLLFRYSLF